VTRNFLLCLAAFLAAACAQDSGLPTPSGKGTIRGINAIPASPGVTFRIEERALDTIAYKGVSAGSRYDDFDYNFNFDVLLPVVGSTRIATVPLKVDANRDYTLVLTGDLDTPDVLVWDIDQREWSDTETVFELRFAHLALSLGEVDVYLAPAGVEPAAGAAIGSVAYGEILPPLELTAEQKILTLTAAGNPADVVYRTSALTYNARNSYLLAVFDGDETDVAPLSVRLITSAGAIASLPDTRFPPTIRFFHAAAAVPPADIYDDEMLTSQIVADHAFGEVTGDIPIAAGALDLTYTHAGNAGVILLEETINTTSGTHNNLVLYETAAGAPDTRYYQPDRRSISVYAKMSLFHAASNRGNLNIYIVDADQPITDVLPRFAIEYASVSSPLPLEAGSYDLYATPTTSRTPVAGPTRLELADGDVVEVVLLDTVDPATAEFSIVPAP
jgi:Domain of unknown function (DUF4397)